MKTFRFRFVVLFFILVAGLAACRPELPANTDDNSDLTATAASPAGAMISEATETAGATEATGATDTTGASITTKPQEAEQLESKTTPIPEQLESKTTPIPEQSESKTTPISGLSGSEMSPIPQPESQALQLNESDSKALSPESIGAADASQVPQGLSASGLPIYAVHNYTEFIAAVGSDREIHIMPGDYDPVQFDKAAQAITARNLTLTGIPADGEKYVSFSNSLRSSIVLRFENSSNIRIRNLNLGHGEQESCSGNVLEFDQCSDIRIEDCRVYGSGYIGLVLESCDRVYTLNTVIEDCSGSTIKLDGSTDVVFSGCTFRDKPILFHFKQTQPVKLENSHFIGNYGPLTRWVAPEYIPITTKTGFEPGLDTEEWDDGKRLAGVFLNSYETGSLSYTDSYEGIPQALESQALKKLAENLKTLEGKYILSIEGKERDWRISPDSAVINILVDPAADTPYLPEIQKLKQLVPLIEACPVRISVAIREQTYPSPLRALFDFADGDLARYLNNGPETALDDYGTVYLKSFNLKRDELDGILNPEQYPDVIKAANQACDLLIVNDTPFYGQYFSNLFYVLKNNRLWYFFAIENYVGEGDLVHYGTDMLFRMDVKTGEIAVLTDNRTLTLLGQPTEEEGKKVLNALSALTPGKEEITGTLQQDCMIKVRDARGKPGYIVVYTESDEYDRELFLHHYYIISISENTSEADRMEPIHLRDFSNILDN